MLRDLYYVYIMLWERNTAAALLITGCLIILVGATVHAAFFED